MEMATATRLNTSTGPGKPVLAAGDVTLETETEGTTEEGEDDGVPYDRGWAWMVFFGEPLLTVSEGTDWRVGHCLC